MKMRLMFTVVCLAASAVCVPAQNVYKLFDATPITSSAAPLRISWKTPPFATNQISLSCPAGQTHQSTLTGPFGGQLIVDNFLAVNGTNVCPAGGYCFSGTFLEPVDQLGEPMESSYLGVNPIDVSAHIKASGAYTFNLVDYGSTFGNSEIYLNTSCSLVQAASTVCHYDRKTRSYSTLNVGPDTLSKHLSHGDTEGPCSQ